MGGILAVYGSPRREGNSSLLLKSAVRGAREAGATVEEVWLRDLRMAPCLETYACMKDGRCAILDDFQWMYDRLDECDALMLASPIFFYTVSAHTKILMDRCQSFWVRKYRLEKKETEGAQTPGKPGLFISVGATGGRKLFEGSLLTVRYFFDVLGMELWQSLLYRGLDLEGDVLKHPEYLEEAHDAGRRLSAVVLEKSASMGKR